MDNKQTEKRVSEKWYKKINWTSPKTIKIILLIIAFIVLAVLYLNFTSSKTKVSSLTTSTTYSREYMSTIDYTNYLENKIGSTIRGMNGVTQVSVMVTLNGSVELILAENEDHRSNTTTNAGNTTSSETRVSEPIIVSRSGTQTPLVLYEKLPSVAGVIVVAKGETTAIRLDIINALKTLLNIPSANIQVFS